MATELPTGRVSVPEDVVRRSFGEETVLLNLGSGQYHGLNPTATLMLDLLEETGDAQETARRVAVRVDVPLEAVAADLALFCAQLHARGLIAVE